MRACVRACVFMSVCAYTQNYRSSRPQNMILEKSVDFANTWTPLQYYNKYCHGKNKTNDLITAETPDAVICTDRYSTEVPYSGGTVKFDVRNDRFVLFLGPSYADVARLYEAFETTNLARFLRMTNLRIRLLEPATDGREKAGSGDLVKYHYAISDITVYGG